MNGEKENQPAFRCGICGEKTDGTECTRCRICGTLTCKNCFGVSCETKYCIAVCLPCSNEHLLHGEMFNHSCYASGRQLMFLQAWDHSGLDFQVFKQIWKSPQVRFLCCECFEDKERLLGEGLGKFHKHALVEDWLMDFPASAVEGLNQEEIESLARKLEWKANRYGYGLLGDVEDFLIQLRDS